MEKVTFLYLLVGFTYSVCGKLKYQLLALLLLYIDISKM